MFERIIPGVVAAVLAGFGLVSLEARADVPRKPLTQAQRDRSRPLLTRHDQATYTDGWRFVPLPQTVCRRGEATGIGIHAPPAGASTNKALLVMMGGGACDTVLNCAKNPASFDADWFRASVTGEWLVWPGFLKQGVFDSLHSQWWETSRPDNEIANYYQVFIPYCSGDMHAGDDLSAEVTDPLLGSYWEYFNGYENTRRFFQYVVQHVVPNLTRPAEIVLSGVSAGAFGALTNAHRLREMLPADVKLTLLSDSAPPLTGSAATGGDYFHACQQRHWANTFHYERTFLAKCGSACPAAEWLAPWTDYQLSHYPQMPEAFLSSTKDATILGLMNGAQDLPACQAQGSLPTVDEAAFTAGLTALRNRLQLATQLHGTPTASYVIGGSSQHVWSYAAYYSADARRGTPSLQRWVQGLFTRGTTPPSYVHHVTPR